MSATLDSRSPHPGQTAGSPRPRTAVRVLLPAGTDLDRVAGAVTAALAGLPDLATGPAGWAPLRRTAGSAGEAEAQLRAVERSAIAPTAVLVDAAGRGRLGLLLDSVDDATAGWLLERIAARYAQIPDHVPTVPGPRVDEPPLTDDLLAELRAELADLPLDVALPRRLRAGVERYATHDIRVPAGLSGQLAEHAADSGTATAALVVGALLTVLHRYSRQHTLMIGVRRDRPSATAVRGAVADLVPVPSTIAGAATAGGIAAATAAALDRAATRPAVPVALLAELLGRPLAGPADQLFGIVVTLARPLAQPLMREGRWTCSHAVLDGGGPELELVAGPVDDPDAGELTLRFRYRADLFDPALIPALGRHLVRVLEQLPDRADLPVHRLDLLSPDEVHTLCSVYSGTPDPWRPRETLARTVERHARERGHLPAIVDAGGEISYAELDARTKGLARALAAVGVARGDVVALAAERRAEWVMALLAVGRLGAVLLPFDPSTPALRMRAVIEQIGARLLLHTGSGPAGGPVGCPVLALSTEQTSLRAPDAPQALLGDIAFVMQTSGSTGVPKLVMGQQTVLAHIGASFAGITRLRAGDRASWMTPTGFGTTLAEVSQALVAGAALHPVPGEIIASAAALRDWLVERRINVCFAITQVGDALQWQDWPSGTELRVLIMGGEKLHHWGPPDLPFEVAVGYGCHEALFVASPLHPWDERLTASRATAADRLAPPPIGRPNPGVRLHVLGEHGELMPPGSIGEIWFDSPEAALGYWGDPMQTADRFRPDPFGPSGSRLYRTGDLGRFRGDGLLEHHGRVDDMIKVRGCRVELGEVEAVLSGHPAVREAAVVTVRDALGETQLVACTVTEGPVEPAQLRGHLADRLPDYMVPIAFIALPALPRNVNGKIDRSNLLPEDWTLSRVRPPYREPAGDLERMICRLWSELLDDRIGADDSFLDLGASSLHAGRMADRLRAATHRVVTVQEVFLFPTPAGLARLLASRPRDVDADPELPRPVRRSTR